MAYAVSQHLTKQLLGLGHPQGSFLGLVSWRRGEQGFSLPLADIIEHGGGLGCNPAPRSYLCKVLRNMQS